MKFIATVEIGIEASSLEQAQKVASYILRDISTWDISTGEFGAWDSYLLFVEVEQRP